MVLSLNESQIIWIAGLFEGEGYFGIDARSVKRYTVSTTPPSPYLRVSMVDEDVIARFSFLVKKSYFSPTRRTTTGKTVYCVEIGDGKTLQYLLPRIFPYLGERRQKRVQECLDLLQKWDIWYSTGSRKKMAKLGSQASVLARKRKKEQPKKKSD